MICKIWCDRLFENTVFVKGRNTSKCYCGDEMSVNDCVPVKPIARIMGSIAHQKLSIDSDLALGSVIRLNLAT